MTALLCSILTLWTHISTYSVYSESWVVQWTFLSLSHESDGSVVISVFTHTNKYRDFHSHPSLVNKAAVVKALFPQVRSISFSITQQVSEEQYNPLWVLHETTPFPLWCLTKGVFITSYATEKFPWKPFPICAHVFNRKLVLKCAGVEAVGLVWTKIRVFTKKKINFPIFKLATPLTVAGLGHVLTNNLRLTDLLNLRCNC